MNKYNWNGIKYPSKQMTGKRLRKIIQKPSLFQNITQIILLMIPNEEEEEEEEGWHYLAVKNYLHYNMYFLFL